MVEAPKSPDLTAFAGFLAEYPRSFACWDLGATDRYDLIAWLNRYPVRAQHQHAVQRGEFAVMELTRPHHNQLGICVAWTDRYLRDGVSRPQVTNGDLVKVFDSAGVYWQLTNALADVRQGVRSFRSRDRTIEIGYTGNAPFDGLDRMLGLLDEITRIPPRPPAESESVRRLLEDGTAVGRWDSIGLLSREEYRALAARIFERRVELADTVQVGRATLGDAVSVLTELLARAVHAYTLCLVGIEDPALTVPRLTRDALVAATSIQTKLDRAIVAEVIDALTLNIAECDDPCLTPLVPCGRDLALVSGLMVPGSHVRNFLARLQLDPARFGELGRQLGLLGSRTVAKTLRAALPGTRVLERVPVLRPDRSQAGDLDVVAFDPVAGDTLILEVLWDIGVDGSVESGRTEQRAFAKRAQVRRLHEAIARGEAAPAWPPGPTPPAAGASQWFILTSNILPIAPDPLASGTPIRSHRLLQGLLNRHKTIGELVPALIDPPLPPLPLAATRWEWLRFGPYRVRVEVLPV